MFSLSRPLSLLLFPLFFISAWADDSPKILREDTEWVEISIPGVHKTEAAHVLLIGDSITAGYFWPVTEKLKGKAIVAKLATSKSVGDPGLLQEVAYVLSHCKFDVVHFNNGLHGRDYTEADYRKHFPELIAAIRKGAPQAKLIWASSTPIREGEKFAKIEAFTERVKERNRIAAEVVSQEGVPVNDLYSLVVDHPEFYGDGVHFNPQGVEAKARQVAEVIEKALAK